MQRRIIDFAHSIDPELASSLAESLDDDEARKDSRERIKLQELRKQIADDSVGAVSEKIKKRELPSTMWTLLGQLNANRVQPLQVGNTRKYVELISDEPLDRAFPVLAWVIENAVRRRGQSEEGQKILRGFYEATMIGCELAFRLRGRTSIHSREVFHSQTATTNRKSMVVHSGERELALKFLTEWLASNATQYLKICDPYFGPEDLETLQLVLGTVPNIGVSILTSKKHQEQEASAIPTEELYQQRWRSMSDQDPPCTEVVVIGTHSGELPIHDRWWLTKGKGLRMGTSFNALGGKKESEISLLSDDEADEREREVDDFISLKKREHKGEKLNIHLFALS